MKTLIHAMLFLFPMARGAMKTEAPALKSENRRRARDEFSRMKENDRKILKLLKKRQKGGAILMKSSGKITALTRVRGKILNSVLAANTRPVMFIARAGGDNDLIENAELRCAGRVELKRVVARCDLLVLDGEEYKVNVTITDLDGAGGVRPDEYHTGKEKAFLTGSLASFLEGVAGAAKDVVLSPFGAVTGTGTRGKNAVTEGVAGVARRAGGELSEDAEKSLEVAYVKAGREVLIFFNKSLDLEIRR